MPPDFAEAICESDILAGALAAGLLFRGAEVEALAAGAGVLLEAGVDAGTDIGGADAVAGALWPEELALLRRLVFGVLSVEGIDEDEGEEEAAGGCAVSEVASALFRLRLLLLLLEPVELVEASAAAGAAPLELVASSDFLPRLLFFDELLELVSAAFAVVLDAESSEDFLRLRLLLLPVVEESAGAAAEAAESSLFDFRLLDFDLGEDVSAVVELPVLLSLEADFLLFFDFELLLDVSEAVCVVSLESLFDFDFFFELLLVEVLWSSDGLAEAWASVFDAPNANSRHSNRTLSFME